MYFTIGNGLDDERAELYKSIGATSIESYVTWETVEGKGKDQWDWSSWDAEVEMMKKHGFKWVPFIIIGPAYSVPGWFRETKDHIPCRCLEHGIDSKIESLWNPHLRKWITRFLKAFAERYGNQGIIESVLLGIQGDFGEAIFSVFGGQWTFIIPGEYHNHEGFWCGEPLALADFRKSVAKKYKKIEALNNAWGTTHADFEQVDYPARGEDEIKKFKQMAADSNPYARRRWLDFIDWYRGAMTNLADWWMRETRKAFPDNDIYLCTGGFGTPEHGSDFAEQCRVSAKHGGGVRITNEASSYTANYSMTRWVASSGKHYGAYFGFEPAARVDEKGVVARIYNATASGANQLHDYHRNCVSTPERVEIVRKHSDHIFHVPEPIVPVALWYPNVSATLKWGEHHDPVDTLKSGDFLEKTEPMRDLCDIDFLDETMLRSGALEDHPVLVVIDGPVMETSDARRIAKWVRAGGRLIVMDVAKFESVEATDEPEKLLFGRNSQGRKLGKGSVVRVEGWDALAAALGQTLEELDLPVYDLKVDGVFGTQIEPGRFLLLNMTDADVPMHIRMNGKSMDVVAGAATITDTKSR